MSWFSSTRATAVHAVLFCLVAVVAMFDLTLNFITDLLQFRVRRDVWHRYFIGFFRAPLKASGMGQFWAAVVQNPAVVRDILLLGAAQAVFDPHRQQLLQDCEHEEDETNEDKENMENEKESTSAFFTKANNNNNSITTTITRRELELAQIYMRHSTATYGMAGMAVSDFMCHGIEPNNSVDHGSRHNRKNLSRRNSQTTFDVVHGSDLSTVLSHLPGVKQASDVWLSDIGLGESPKTGRLRHAVMVDHDTKRVVLSIRGTYTLTGIVTCLAGFATPFHGGQAHAACAEMAVAIWNESAGPVIERHMATLPADYGLVLTGHSLGGAVANLITIHLYALRKQQQLPALDGRPMECFCYACPPTFAPASAAPEAIQNTTAFVHNQDCVPTLSGHGLRLLFHHLHDMRQAADNNHKNEEKHEQEQQEQDSTSAASSSSSTTTSLWQVVRNQLWHGQAPAPHLQQALEQSARTTLPRLDCAPVLEIPARFLVWLEKSSSSTNNNNLESYQIHHHSCRKFANRCLQFHPTMGFDHVSCSYDRALAVIVSQQDLFLDDDVDETASTATTATSSSNEELEQSAQQQQVPAPESALASSSLSSARRHWRKFLSKQVVRGATAALYGQDPHHHAHHHHHHHHHAHQQHHADHHHVQHQPSPATTTPTPSL